ncbi:MAG: molybdopterin cofactor-binding domain-containing protein [Deferrisomatales bacterium]|nr:molybdopterin cofactor-binding domain-containing protein [Deferrisomatales bacterium]
MGDGRERGGAGTSGWSLPLDRREFLLRVGVLGGGILVYASLGAPPARARFRERRRLTGPLPGDFNAFLRIGVDGRVACYTGKVEMGQGIDASLAQILADELDVDYGSIDMVMGDTDLCPYDRGTFGSLSIRSFGPVLRAAAAEARAVLLELAARHLGSPSGDLTVQGGLVVDRTVPGKRVTYAELTKGRVIERHVEHRPAVKPEEEYRVAGTSPPSRDLLDKVTGRARYGADTRLPGMLYASILRPPAHGAPLRSVDTSAAAAMEGVRVVEEDGLVAVLHATPDGAAKALSAIRAEFGPVPDTPDNRGIFDHILRTAPAGNLLTERGSLEEGRRRAAKVFEHTYLDPYLAHAPLEPHASTAVFDGDRVTVWASTQSPFRVRDRVGEALGLPPEKVRVIPTAVGGGYGGKNTNIEAEEAARLAARTGRPVQVAWTREEEFFHDDFRPAAVVKVASGLDGSGRIAFWDYAVHMAGDDGARTFYDVPHLREVSHGHWRGSRGVHPFATGPWRAPATITNTFAREAQTDVMAAAAGADAVAFRLAHLSDRKMQAVLTACAAKFGWTPAASPSRRGFGVACGIRSETYVVTMAEVTVDAGTGEVRVERVVCAQDMGLAVNPRGAALQMEGCLTMSLGYTLSEELRFRGGDVLDRGFDTYEIPRFSRVPRIETVLVRSDDTPAKGGGEPAMVCVGAAVANAVYDATGVRLHQLPLTPARVKAAL